MSSRNAPKDNRSPATTAAFRWLRAKLRQLRRAPRLCRPALKLALLVLLDLSRALRRTLGLNNLRSGGVHAFTNADGLTRTRT